jgi:hypothetical protein
MKKLLQKFETSMFAVVFAEAGEFKTAQEIMLKKEDYETEKPPFNKKLEGAKTLRAN